MSSKANAPAGVSVAFRHMRCVIAIQIAAVLFLAAIAEGFPRSVQVSVGNETVPPGGTVQLKFFLAKPAFIGSGELSMDLDPSVFGSVASVAVFGANGDAAGVAQIQSLHVDVHFSAPSAGIGNLSEVPVVVVNATVLPTVVPGQTATVTADPTGSPWLGLVVPDGTGGTTQPTYSVSVSPGTVTIGGTLSIASITPGGGVLPGGTAITIQGTGFSSANTAEIDGATVGSVQVVGPQMMSLILGGPTELTGKRIRVMNPDGSEVDAFAFAPAVPVSAPGIVPLDGSIPIPAVQTFTAAYLAGTSFVLILNPNAAAVQFVEDSFDPFDDLGSEQAFTIPAGGSQLLQTKDVRTGPTLLIASAPVQIVQLISFSPTSSAYRFLGSAPAAAVVPPLQVDAGTSDQTSSLSWTWQIGTAAPQAQTIGASLPSDQPSTNYTVAVATSSGGPWLSVTPSGTINCPLVPVSTPGGCPNLQVSVNPSSLTPGIYRGTVTITPVATVFRTAGEPAVIPVALTVTASPLGQTLIVPLFNDPVFVPPPGFFTGPVSVSVVTDGGGNWLSATPNGGTAVGTTAPTSITVTTNTNGLGAGTYSGDVVVTGSGNTLVIPASVQVTGPLDLSAYYPQSSPLAGGLGSLNLAVQAGAGPPPAQALLVSISNCAIPLQCVTVTPNDLSSVVASVQTHSGGNWLSASISQSQGAVIVNANPAGLGVGVYLGAVTLSASGVAPYQFPVVLVVEGGSQPALNAGPGPFGICASSASVPITFTVQVSTSDGGGWLTVGSTSGTTPTCFSYSWPNNLPAGNYSGSIVITGGSQSITIPVMFNVAEPPGSPLLGAFVSAESAMPGALYPGEVVAIDGLNLGPVTPVTLPADTQGQFPTTVSGATVLIGGIPAPILFASQTLISAQVPTELTGSSATVQVQNGSGSTAAWAVPLATPPTTQPTTRPHPRIH